MLCNFYDSGDQNGYIIIVDAEIDEDTFKTMYYRMKACNSGEVYLSLKYKYEKDQPQSCKESRANHFEQRDHGNS